MHLHPADPRGTQVKLSELLACLILVMGVVALVWAIGATIAVGH